MRHVPIVVVATALVVPSSAPDTIRRNLKGKWGGSHCRQTELRVVCIRVTTVNLESSLQPAALTIQNDNFVCARTPPNYRFVEVKLIDLLRLCCPPYAVNSRPLYTGFERLQPFLFDSAPSTHLAASVGDRTTVDLSFCNLYLVTKFEWSVLSDTYSW